MQSIQNKQTIKNCLLCYFISFGKCPCYSQCIVVQSGCTGFLSMQYWFIETVYCAGKNCLSLFFEISAALEKVPHFEGL